MDLAQLWRNTLQNLKINGLRSCVDVLEKNSSTVDGARCGKTIPRRTAVIRLDGVELRRGGVKVLDDASLVVQRRQKVGVVGANGAGKTSLFSLLLGELEPDRGDVELPAGIAAATVAQEAPAGDSPLIDYVTCGDARIASIRARLADAEAHGDACRQAIAHADLEAIHGYAAQAQASRILHGLGFAPGDESRTLDALSGGWRMRAALARTLAARSELLLLDEPTNHLDLDAVVWLEAWLRRYPGTLLLISHDREFLDPVVDHVALVRDGRISVYTGNYSAFERLRAVEMEHSRRTAARLQRERARIQAFVDRFRYKASKARQAQSRLKALETHAGGRTARRSEAVRLRLLRAGAFHPGPRRRSNRLPSDTVTARC